jgi:hypothetical protein
MVKQTIAGLPGAFRDGPVARQVDLRGDQEFRGRWGYV